MENNCLKQAPEKIFEKSFSLEKLKSLAYRLREGKDISEFERKEVESKVIFIKNDQNFAPSWPEIEGLKKCKKMNIWDPLPRGSRVVYRLWGKGAFGGDYGFSDYGVYSPTGYYRRSNRVSFGLVKMIVDNRINDTYVKSHWTSTAISKAKEWADKMSKDYLKDFGGKKTRGVYHFGEKYYVNVSIEDGVLIDECRGIDKTKWWNSPVFETTPNDPRVVKAREEKEIEENRERDIEILRNEVVERVKKIYPEIFNEFRERIGDRYPIDPKDERYGNYIENSAIISVIFGSPFTNPFF